MTDDEQFRREREGRWFPTGVAEGLRLPVTKGEYERALMDVSEAHAFHRTLTELAESGQIHLTSEQIEVIGRVALGTYGVSVQGLRRALAKRVEAEPMIRHPMGLW